jgi:hypothetical protein
MGSVVEAVATMAAKVMQNAKKVRFISSFLLFCLQRYEKKDNWQLIIDIYFLSLQFK